ncbi:MAG: hypothetical protein ACI8W8_001668 [Rhodothermales bacterium]|jgi:hypothetical protein
MNLHSTGKPWDGLFPAQPFAFRFGAKPGDPGRFFADSADHAQRVQWRREILDAHPERHLLHTARAKPAVSELAAWAGLPGGNCQALALHWEQDFLLLLPDADGQPVFVEGAVCFPSSWAPEEKLGLTVPAIHSSVPTLNERLGPRIGSFLAGIRPEKAWERMNWGVSAAAELNQHPALGLARLEPPFALDQLWVRREDQLLFRLPISGALIFGINVTNISVSEIAADAQGRAGLRQTLETMPAEIAAYKGLSAGRPLLLDLLADHGSRSR